MSCSVIVYCGFNLKAQPDFFLKINQQSHAGEPDLHGFSSSDV